MISVIGASSVSVLCNLKATIIRNTPQECQIRLLLKGEAHWARDHALRPHASGQFCASVTEGSARMVAGVLQRVGCEARARLKKSFLKPKTCELETTLHFLACRLISGCVAGPHSPSQVPSLLGREKLWQLAPRLVTRVVLVAVVAIEIAARSNLHDELVDRGGCSISKRAASRANILSRDRYTPIR